MVINQKDIDPPPLDLQARAGVTNSDLLLHDGSALTFNLELFGVPFYLRECVMMSPPELGTRKLFDTIYKIVYSISHKLTS